MARILICALLALTLCVGCDGVGPMSEKEQPHLTGTPEDLRILRLEGIRNPDSEAGQRRLRQLKRDRDMLQDILKEAEDRNMRPK